MVCLTPRNNGVPCGVCPRCRLNRQRDWTFRLSYERDASDFVFWLALTFDEEHLPQVLSSEKAAREPSRHFFESIRKHYGDKLQVKHYLVSEYGDAGDRWHHHCLLFCRCPGASDDQKLALKDDLFKFLHCNDWEADNPVWPYGGVKWSPLHSGVFPYVTNYVNKPEIIDPNNPHPIKPFTRISQGIGLDYLERIDRRNFTATGNLSVYFEGKKKVLPRYYRKKLFYEGPASIYHEKEKIVNEKKAYNRLLRTAAVYEHDHSISYDEFRMHQAANEFRMYQEKLKKRKSL